MTYRNFVHSERGQVWIVEQSSGVDIDGALSPAFLAHRPCRVNYSPEPWPGDTLVRPPLTPINASGTPAATCGIGIDI